MPNYLRVGKQARRLAINDRGSFTLEASFVAPLLVVATLLLVALALYVFGLVQLHRTASERVERSAFEWNSSHTPGAADSSLYWRLGEGMASWFGAAAGMGEQRLQLPATPAGGSSSGLMVKLRKAADLLPSAIEGYISLTDHLAFRKLHAYFERPFPLRAMSFFGTMPAVEQARADATIVDPVEMIRLVDLTRTYTAVIRGRISPKQAKDALQEPQPVDGGSVSIRSERQASAYLRKVTGGSQRTYPMEQGQSRVVDALDDGGIAHQAFYTYTEPQLLVDQMPKDIRLLSQGQVKGVVWHFFLPPGKLGPSASLRSQLERKGIIVVVHQ